MALISKLERVSRNSRIHEEVEATYNIVNQGGEKYVQINTYGSNERKVKGQVSQTIQLSEEAINN